MDLSKPYLCDPAKQAAWLHLYFAKTGSDIERKIILTTTALVADLHDADTSHKTSKIVFLACDSPCSLHRNHIQAIYDFGHTNFLKNTTKNAQRSKSIASKDNKEREKN